MGSASWRLFERFGVELEYMIVDRDSLGVRPIAVQLLGPGGDVQFDDVTWSNELVAHVIELKNSEPAPSLPGLAERFQASVLEINNRLAPLHAGLLPTAMHPTMNPPHETTLWTHEYSEVYAAFDRIFHCRGHGWSNLQSMHLNLPFASDDEFGRLHAAIRLVLPLLPALAASSPLQEGRRTGLLDTRLDNYRNNAARIPSVCGAVIPEPVFTEAEYRETILEPIWRDLAPMDPTGLLRNEFANARGAIARFSRGSIEIRVIDVQETPLADLAIARLVVAVLKACATERWADLRAQMAWPVAPLAGIFRDVLRDADRALIRDEAFLGMFGLTRPLLAGEAWQRISDALMSEEERLSPSMQPLRTILREGCLARRILERMGAADDDRRLQRLYRELADCLAHGRTFHGPTMATAADL